jgi:Mce-associated membrane protein
MADDEDKPGAPPSEAAPNSADLTAMAEEAEADAAEAEAVAAAARARARAIRLRRQAQLAVADLGDEGLGSEAATTEAAPNLRSRRRLLRRPNGSTLLVSAAVMVLLGCLAASGYILWQHRAAAHDRERKAEFAAAARQGVVSLTTLDFNRAPEDVQRVLDNSTGEFRDDFKRRSDDFTKVVQESKVVTKGTVNATAVDSMTGDSAVVLVAATSQVTNDAGAKQEPRAWRLSVTVTKDGDQLKMSRVEFVP